MTADQTAICNRVARQVSRSFHRTSPWLSEAELCSEAWMAMLEALPKCDDNMGDLSGYLYRCAVRACKRLAWKLGVAANIPERSATPSLIGQMRAASVGEEALAVVPTEQESAEEALDAARQREVLSQVVAEYLAAGQEGEAIKAVLYGEAKSREAAEQYGVPLQAVYQGTFKVRRALAADPRVQEVR